MPLLPKGKPYGLRLTHRHASDITAPVRVSSYITAHKLAEQPYSILLHGYTGALDKVPETVASRLLLFRGEDGFDGAAALGLADSTLQALESRGYLTSLSHAEERNLVERITRTIHDRDLATSVTGFMLVPSYRCNLRCPYCFQTHDMHAGCGQFGDILTRQQVDQAFAIYDNLSAPGSMAAKMGLIDATSDVQRDVFATGGDDISLFGGEPLCRDTSEIVRYVLGSAQDRGKSLSAITNAVDLHLFEDILGPHKLSRLQITLDGNRQSHDRRRVGPGFPKTFDIITDHIQLALDSGVRTTVRINIDAANSSAFEELSELFETRGWTSYKHFWAYAAALHQERQRTDPLDRADLVQITMGKFAAEPVHTPIGSYERVAQDLLTSLLGSSGYPFQRSVFCSAETGLLIFDPLGDVYSCWEDIGYVENRVGTYGPQGLSLGSNAASWLSRFPGAIEECINCPYALIHTSGCAAHARKQSGTILASACEGFKEYFPSTLAALYGRFETSLMQWMPPTSDSGGLRPPGL